MSRRPIEIDDLLRLEMPHDPQVSPDGARVAFVLSRLDVEQNDFRSQIWIIEAAGGEPRPFTNGPKRDTSPRWSPDGRHLAFLSNRSGTTQLWVMPATGGEARQVAVFRGGAQAPVWAPDSRRLAVLAKDRAEDREGEDDPPVVRRYRRMTFKFDGQGFYDEERRDQIWVVDRDGGARAQLTSGDYPVAFPSWSPDGREIAFVSNRTETYDLTVDRDVWVADVETKALRQVTHNRGPTLHPLYSPDGRWILYQGHNERPVTGSNHRLWLVPREGGSPRCLTAEFDRSVGTYHASDAGIATLNPPPAWAPDGRAAYFVATDRGAGHLHRVDVETGRIEALTHGPTEAVRMFGVSQIDVVAFTAMDETGPDQVHLLDHGAVRRLTSFNRWLGEVHVARPEPFTFEGAEGRPIEGWVLHPPGFDPARRHPAILRIHGGPHGAYGHLFSHVAQLLAAQGYVVVYTNPRGSQGYGQAFARAVVGDWGGRDYQDLMRGLDAVVARGYVDASRLGVIGGSYGGFMTCWIVGHTGRFAAAVTEVPVSNLISFSGTSDIGPRFMDEEIGGDPWTSEAAFLERSPIRYANRVTTPTLVAANEDDHRCPIEQAEQFFVALRRRGVPAEFLRFRDASHTMGSSGKPRPRLERLRHVVRWFETYLKAGERPVEAGPAAESRAAADED